MKCVYMYIKKCLTEILTVKTDTKDHPLILVINLFSNLLTPFHQLPEANVLHFHG